MMFDVPVLECQDCGEVIRYLTDLEAQRVAENPYNYVVRCVRCRIVTRSHHVMCGEASSGGCFVPWCTCWCHDTLAQTATNLDKPSGGVDDRPVRFWRAQKHVFRPEN